mgnify:FL=1
MDRGTICLEDLAVSYGGRQALAGVSLRVAAGECVLLTGPSGCGKSTLAHCLNGLIPHAIPASLSGRVIVGGHDTARLSVADLASTVGLVFQNPATQLFNLTVQDEVAFGPRNLGLCAGEVGRYVDCALAATGIEHLRERSLRSLSRGEQQRLAIAAVLAMGSRILVLDEPMASLDAKGAGEVVGTLARLHQAGVTIVIIEHRLGAVAHLAPRTVIMSEGRIVADGPTQAVLAERPLLHGLGLCSPADEPPEDWPALLAHRSAPHGQPIVELRGIEAGYGATPVLRALDLTLHAGELAALAGENGAGKSTLARVLAGLIRPRRGQLRLPGGRERAAGRDVVLLFQNPLDQLFCDTVEEEVGFGPCNLGYSDSTAIEAALQATDLTHLRQQPIHCLSVGQQQRTALAALLALKPRLLILDEPTLGQDWGHLCRFMDFLVELSRQGCAILTITHDLKLVQHYARRILLLRDGRIVADGRIGAQSRNEERE